MPENPQAPGPGRLSSLYILPAASPRLPHAAVGPSPRPSSAAVTVAPRFYHLNLVERYKKQWLGKNPVRKLQLLLPSFLRSVTPMAVAATFPGSRGLGELQGPANSAEHMLRALHPCALPPAIRGASAPCPKRESLWASRGISLDERIPACQSSSRPSYSIFILICPQDPAPP